MKKRMSALVVSLAMAVCALSPGVSYADEQLPSQNSGGVLTLADESGDYMSFYPNNIISENSDSFSGVVADEKEDGSVRLIFPAVDKKGNIIVPDPSNTLYGYNLNVDSEGNVYNEIPEFGFGGGGYVAPYGNMENGLIIKFNGYSTDPEDTTKPTEDKQSGDYTIMNGLGTFETSGSLPEGFVIGDVDGVDGISVEDGIAIFRSKTDASYKPANAEKFDGKLPSGVRVGDVDGDREISATDGIMILRKALDSKYVFPLEKKFSGSFTDDENKTYYVNPDGKALLIDTAAFNENGYVTSYKIELSSDGGKTWKSETATPQIAHGKKIKRLVFLDPGVELTKATRSDKSAFLKDESGKLKYVKPGESYTYMTEDNFTGGVENGATYFDDAVNTFFFIDQKSIPITSSLEPDTEYVVKVSAVNPADADKPYKVFQTKMKTSPRATTKAFPTVEGGGTYSTGGRGTADKPGDVYVVTNLSDSVTNPQPGSFRYGLKRLDRADKDSAYPRTIVFAVGGTIQIDPSAGKSARVWDIGSNTTIMGQTAPGEGITLAGGTTNINGENIIIRYMRGRLGSGYDRDGAYALGKNIVVDHCTFSWGVDETFSPKAFINSSVQYTIIANALSIVDKNGANNTDIEVLTGEGEAKHGMATLTNGFQSSFTHNLYANCGTRMPRFEGSFDYNGVDYVNEMEFSNNVVYNWGHNSGYGGDRGNAKVNYTYNYNKPGLNTLEKVKYQFFDCDPGDASLGHSGEKSSYYIFGNYMYGNDAVTANNDSGFTDLGTAAIKLLSPVELDVPYDAEDAQDAYNHVLASVGASFRRDAIDARLIEDVKNGTATFINDQAEAGGWSTETYSSTETDTDKDGIPDSYETAHGTNPNEADSTVIIDDEASPYNGYTYLEVYCYDLLGEWDKEAGYELKTEAQTPENSILSIKDADGNNVVKKDTTVLYAGKSYTAELSNKTLEAELLLNADSLAKAQNGVITFTPSKTGSYNLAVRTTNTDANKSKSITVPIPVSVVNEENGTPTFDIKRQVGTNATEGTVIERANDKEIYMQGAGRIGKTNTSSTYANENYFFYGKKVSGNVTLTAKIDNWAKLDYYQKAGVIITDDISTPNTELYTAGFTMLKAEDLEGSKDVSNGTIYGRNIVSFRRTGAGKDASLSEGNKLSFPHNKAGLPDNYGWVRIEKKGTEVTTSASLDGENWYVLNTYTTNIDGECYVGFMLDAAQDSAEKVNINKVLFTNVEFSEE